MKILIFGGTTEGRLLAGRLRQLGHIVSVSVATDLGAEALDAVSGIEILVGRKSPEEMASLLEDFDLCIDATHPYAVEATANIRRACELSHRELFRLLREESRVQGAVTVDSAEMAAAYLVRQEGNVLLTTGAKELSAFRGLNKKRLYARVLPTHQGIGACEDAGIGHSNIIAMQGPFSRALNEAILKQYDIRWLVTKDGGAPGGFQEKLLAAEHTGARVILIRRPEETGLTMEEILGRLEERP